MRSAVSGVVRDGNGRPQIGALVELLNAQYGLVARTFTDDRGHYSLPRLGQGTYQIKATGSLFLPTIRPDLRLLADSRIVVNLTLSTLYQALAWLPAEPRQADSSSDDWDWTLRLSANRPLLRALDPATARIAAADGVTDLDGPVVIEQGNPACEHTRKAALRSGPARFGEGGLTEQALWSTGDGETRTVLFAAQTGLGPDGLGRLSTTAAYRQQLSPDRSMVTVVTFSDRPDIRTERGTGLATARVRSGTTVRLGDLADVQVGTELAFASIGGTAVVGSHPYAALAAHAGDTTVQYRVATARSAVNTDSLAAEAENDAPLLSEVNGAPRLEQGLHQELRMSRKIGTGFGTWTGDVSLFEDALAHPAVEGALHGGDEAAVDSQNVLFDPGTGTIAVSGQGYHGGGVMALLHDQLSPGTWLSFRYALGKAVTLPGTLPAAGSFANVGQSLTARPASLAAVTAETRIADTGTVLRGSYRWQPAATLTQVDPFESGTADAYLGLSVRQPLHLHRADSGRLEAVLDVRNLLAQGYRPFLSQDGATMYFAQSQRCIAGGLSFSF